MSKARLMRRIAPVLLIAAATLAPASAVPEPYRLCGNAPLTGATPIARDPARLGQFYFDYVNTELGGIDGHPARLQLFDDGSYPAGGRFAVEECRRLGTDLYVGLFGGDPAASVARWAEMAKVPYLHTSTLAPVAIPDASWSALIAPDDGVRMTGLANSLADTRDAVIGIVRYDEAASTFARDALAAGLAAHGHTLTADVLVQKDENMFARAWAELDGVTHLVMHLEALLVQRMLAQKPPTIDARFFTVKDSVATNRVAVTMPDVPLVAFHDPSPVYDPDDVNLPWRAEIEEFHRIFATYGPEPGAVPDDLDWRSYLRAKQLHRFLDALDEDLSPGRIRHAFGTYAESASSAFPACALDFTVAPNLGGRAWHAFRLDGGRWVAAGTCIGSGGADLEAPAIDCGPPVRFALGRVRCKLADAGSGLSSYVTIDRPVTGQPIASETFVEGCPALGSLDLDPSPGVHSIDIHVSDCAGGIAHRNVLVVAT